MKTKFFLSRIGLVMLVVALGLSAALGIAYATNMLNNGGVNGTYVSQAGINGTVPNGWTAINLTGNPLYADSLSTCGCGGSNEKTEGDNAIYIRSQNIETGSDQDHAGWPFKSVWYQKVPNVISGTAYGFAASIVTFCGGSGDWTGCETRGYTMAKSIGIDPTGGTSPTAPSVIWAPDNGVNAAEQGGTIYRGYQDMSVAARAVSTTLTVFVRVTWPYTFHGALGYWDAAYLEKAPVVAMTVPVTSSTPIAVSWLGNRQDAGVSDYWANIKLGYDMQVRVAPTGTWTQILTTTQLTRTTYAGVAGQSYQFRTEPVLYQQDVPSESPARRMVGLFTDPMTVTVVDITPPASAVAPLPTYELVPTFTVRWSGSDNVTASSALTYDVQTRDGLLGTWTNLLTNTTATSMTFPGQAGYTYYFRSRATDQANNLEAYPTVPDYDATTTVLYAIAGTVFNLAEQPIALATLVLTPTPVIKGVSLSDGHYTIYVTATGTYSLTATRAEYTTPPPIRIVVTDSVANANVYLLPKLEAVTNGQFEQGNLGGWTNSGAVPSVITPTAYSGNFAVALGVTPTVGADSSLQQTLYVSSTSSSRVVDTVGVTPTLSFFYRAPITTNVAFTVTITSALTQTETTPPLTSNAWTHGMFDLSSFVSQTITVTFTMRQLNGGELLYLDNISVGRAETVVVRSVYLPLIFR